jgi:hypothetical protein
VIQAKHQANAEFGPLANRQRELMTVISKQTASDNPVFVTVSRGAGVVGFSAG